jgi:hypothetical protein
MTTTNLPIGTSTPIKPLDSPTWTLDEGEEMCTNINDLQKNTVTRLELKGMMDSIEDLAKAYTNKTYQEKEERHNMKNENQCIL